MDETFGKNISKKLSDKYNQKPFDHPKHSATDALITTSKRAIQIRAKVTGDLIGSKIDDKTTKVSRKSP